MDIAKLVKDIGDLRYEAEYRFEFGAPYYQTLREGELRGILIALRDRGFTISRDNEAHVEVSVDLRCRGLRTDDSVARTLIGRRREMQERREREHPSE